MRFKIHQEYYSQLETANSSAQDHFQCINWWISSYIRFHESTNSTSPWQIPQKLVLPFTWYSQGVITESSLVQYYKYSIFGTVFSTVVQVHIYSFYLLNIICPFLMLLIVTEVLSNKVPFNICNDQSKFSIIHQIVAARGFYILSL